MAPTAPKALCPAAVEAASRSEPLPPSVDNDALYGSVAAVLGEDAAKAWWKWLTVTWPDWGRDGWRRLDEARSNCPPP